MIDFSNFPFIIVNGRGVCFSNRCKKLNIILTPSLSWDNQVSAVICKVNSMLFNLRRKAFQSQFIVRKQLITTTV